MRSFVAPRRAVSEPPVQNQTLSIHPPALRAARQRTAAHAPVAGRPPETTEARDRALVVAALHLVPAGIKWGVAHAARAQVSLAVLSAVSGVLSLGKGALCWWGRSDIAHRAADRADLQALDVHLNHPARHPDPVVQADAARVAQGLRLLACERRVSTALPLALSAAALLLEGWTVSEAGSGPSGSDGQSAHLQAWAVAAMALSLATDLAGAFSLRGAAAPPAATRAADIAPGAAPSLAVATGPAVPDELAAEDFLRGPTREHPAQAPAAPGTRPVTDWGLKVSADVLGSRAVAARDLQVGRRRSDPH